MTSNKLDIDAALIQKSFNKYFEIKDPEDQLEIEKHLLMYKFLSEIEKVTARKGISRKKLAELIGTSPSYITQLYQGKKTISLEMLARMQKALNITFTVGIAISEKNVTKNVKFDLVPDTKSLTAAEKVALTALMKNGSIYRSSLKNRTR